MGDKDIILICYKHEGRPEKDQLPLYLYKQAECWRKRHSDKEHTLYIGTNVSSIQSKNDKTWSINMKCNFITSIWKPFTNILFLVNKQILPPMS